MLRSLACCLILAGVLLAATPASAETPSADALPGTPQTAEWCAEVYVDVPPKVILGPDAVGCYLRFVRDLSWDLTTYAYDTWRCLQWHPYMCIEI